MLPAAVRASVRAVAVIALVASSQANAQCSDGRQGACPGGPVRIDTNAVALFPFRVASADTLLGEGFAELLAPEFTGVGSPRAVNMATTLNAWRRAGGGLRSPLTEEDARRVARSFGAGLMIQGSVVGVAAGRLTVTASLVNTRTGATIGSASRASAPADSIDYLARACATNLLGAVGARIAEASRLSTSPAAMRLYMEGLAFARRGLLDRARASFEASMADDSAFGLAVYQRWLRSVPLYDGPWSGRVLAMRSRLPVRERTFVDGVFGSTPGAPRDARRELQDRRNAAERLVDSPEAWFYYGDLIFHYAKSVVRHDSLLPLARLYFDRALALDSLPSYAEHLLQVATRLRDTSLARRLIAARRTTEDGDWAHTWAAASAIGDTATLARLRRSANRGSVGGVGLSSIWDTPAPFSLIEEGSGYIASMQRARGASVDRTFLWTANVLRGRMQSAAQLLSKDREMFGTGWPPATGEVATDSAILVQLRRTADSPLPNRARCAEANVRAQRTRADEPEFSLAGLPSRCARMLTAWFASSRGTLSTAELASVDSLIGAGGIGDFYGFEHRLLARIYEGRGDTVRALRAVQLYPADYMNIWLPPTLREEGRLLLMTRDTTRAIKAYNHYLELYREAQPPFVAERDSIRALVATLTRRR